MAAEGSGGHLIPALEVSRALASRQAFVCLLYAHRKQTAGLLEDLLRDTDVDRVQIQPIALSSCPVPAIRGIWRLWQARAVWCVARERFAMFHPQVVVGFGGWFCVPVILAARKQHIPVLIHEQNVNLGRANRFLQPFADQIALSFQESRSQLNGTPAVITGLPIRHTIGTARRDEAASRFGFDPHAPTILILGGSQGSRSINRLVGQMLEGLSWQERRAWQFLHLTGAQEHAVVQQSYDAAGLRRVVVPHLGDMAMAYAMADVVVARAGASTIAELAKVGKPSILIPFPYAKGHQRANARLVESLGAGVRLEEATATPHRLLGLLRQLLSDGRLRRMMGAQMQTLARPEATQRLACAILNVAKTDAQR